MLNCRGRDASVWHERLRQQLSRRAVRSLPQTECETYICACHRGARQINVHPCFFSALTLFRQRCLRVWAQLSHTVWTGNATTGIQKTVYSNTHSTSMIVDVVLSRASLCSIQIFNRACIFFWIVCIFYRVKIFAEMRIYSRRLIMFSDQKMVLHIWLFIFINALN